MSEAGPTSVTEELDPFELPDWLGEGAVTWATEAGLAGHLVPGTLSGAPDQALPCDLLAVDQAYPAPVVDRAVRTRVHQVWQHGQVLVVLHDGRTAVATPGSSYDADRVLEAFSRLALAVGADPRRWSVRLGLGTRRR